MINRIILIKIVVTILILLGTISCYLDPDRSEVILTADLRIGNVSIGNPNSTGHYRMITFDINWGYSWRTSEPPGNWDAAWIFIKYQVNGGEWKHATLSAISEEHLSPRGATIESTSDGKGVYIYRSEDGVGEFRASGVSLRWNYRLDNVADNSTVTIRVLGLEMVYIPEGSFYAGDNGASMASFTKGSSDGRSWHITSEDAIEVTNTASNGYYYTSSKDFWSDEFNAHEDVTGTAFTIPAEFPKGFRAIYCMKYELTQQQYVDFLNTLTSTQASNRYDTVNNNQFGYTISKSQELYSTTHPQRACGFLAPADAFAYADWAGLRPMSELEFEKICRGSGNLPIDTEYAWGSTYCRNATGYSSNESDRQYLTSIRANTLFDDGVSRPPSPLNSGIFFEAGKSRELSGTSFYGVLDMSGNLDETCISIGNQYGRVFSYRNGDGHLAIDGFTDESNWPLRDGQGAGFRGGTLAQDQHCLQVSDRTEASVEFDWNHRHIPVGWRGVRTK